VSASREDLVCVVEIPQGSRNKYEYDPERGVIKLDRFLFTSVVYPADYGYVPHTLALDGDPLDAMTCVSEATFPGCLIPARAVALFRMHDEAGEDDKIICVPCNDPNWTRVETLDDLPKQLRDEIEHFFSIYKQPEGKPVEIDGWHPREDALKILAEARQRFADGGRAER
jgi:inorganic pyrophosphatase